MTLYTGHSVKYGTTVLAGLDNLNANTNTEVDNKVGIGSIYPPFAVVRGQKPTIQFQSHAIADLLDVTGLVGADIDDTNNLIAYFAKMDGQLPDATDPNTVHRSYTCERGVLVPRRLSCQHQQDAVIDAEAVLYSDDGETEPIEIADNATLPTLTRDNVRHTLHSVKLCNIDMGCVTSVTIDFGNGVRTRGCNSDIWDKNIEQPGIQPKITITGIDIEKFEASGIPLEGKGGTHANTVIYLRKYSEDGILFVDGVTAEHIKIDAEGLAVVTSHTGQGSDTSELTVEFTCTLDATANAPIGIDTTSALP